MINQRPAQLTDAGRVGAILSGFIDTTPWMPRIHTRAQDIAHAEMMIKRGWVRVAEKDNVLAGFVALHEGDMNALYMATDFCGQGIGSAIMRQLQNENDRLTLWTFQANTGAQRFYMAHGFVEVARTQGEGNDEQLPDIRFEWTKGGI